MVYTPILTPPVLKRPQPTKTIKSQKPRASDGWSPGMLYLDGTPNQVIADTEFIQRNSGSGGGMFMVTGMHAIMKGLKIRNCVLRCVPTKNGVRWIIRGYNFEGEMVEVALLGVDEEHGAYFGIHGNFLMQDVTIAECGSNGLQLSLSVIGQQPEDSPSWSRDRTLTIRGVNILECGKKGGTRLGFAFTHFRHGPLFKIDAERLFVQTVKQDDIIKDSSGNMSDSSGGMVFGYCHTVRIANSACEMEDPEKGLIQFYDYPDTSLADCGPRNIILDTWKGYGASVDIRVDAVDSVRIKNCSGNAQLRLWKWKPPTTGQQIGKFEQWKTQAISTPYSQG